MSPRRRLNFSEVANCERRGCGSSMSMMPVTAGAGREDRDPVGQQHRLAGLWVTKTMVFRVRLSRADRSSPSTMRVCSSSAAKGSSIRMNSVSRLSARASEARCFMPPESWPGKWPAKSAGPTASSACAARSAASGFATPWNLSASPMLSRIVFHGNSACSWKTKATLRGIGPVTGWPSTSIVPRRGRTRLANMLSSVVLPQPLGPISASSSPRLTSSETSSRVATWEALPGTP